ncbi:MAG: diguanylate cyclase [Dehalococcoidia bacterium]
MPAATPPANLAPDDVKKHYISALKLSHLTRAAFFVVAAIFFAWATPFLPFGLDAREYTSATAMAMMLAFMSVGLAVLSTLYFMRAARRRDVLLAWSAVFDESTGLHNRQYFLDRLDLEIARATVANRSFRIFLLQARRQDPSGRFVSMSREDLADFAKTVRETVDTNDTLASFRPDELALLTPSVVPTLMEPIEDRLLEALRRFTTRARKGKAWKIRMGSASFGADVDDPAKLLEETRRELLSSAPMMLTLEDKTGDPADRAA